MRMTGRWYVLRSFSHATAFAPVLTLSLHDALPISRPSTSGAIGKLIRFMSKPTTPNTTTTQRLKVLFATANAPISAVKMMSGYRYEYGRRKSCAKTGRSEEHTSELQSRGHLVCRLLLEKKKGQMKSHTDRVWVANWHGDIPNALEPIEQVTNQLLQRRVTEQQKAAERELRRTGRPTKPI